LEYDAIEAHAEFHQLTYHLPLEFLRSHEELQQHAEADQKTEAIAEYESDLDAEEDAMYEQYEK
jgi:hypothetical protein